MKTALKVLGGIILLALVIFVIMGLTGEKTYDVNRSVQIEAPPEAIFPYVVSLNKQAEWSPWAQKDPEMKNEYIGEEGAIGSINKWDGPVSGVGEQEITAIDPYKGIETKLRFMEPYEDEANAYVTLEPNQNGTSVTWGFKGENGFVQRAMFKMMGMDLDEMVGNDYEEGLGMLKALSEKAHADMEAARAAEAVMSDAELEEPVIE